MSRVEDRGQIVFQADGLAQLIAALHDDNFRVVGPTVQDGAILFDDIETVTDLPIGWTDEHEGGHYRLSRRRDSAAFGYVVGPRGLKHYLHPPTQPLWRATKTEDGVRFDGPSGPEKPFAFIGARPCDVRTMEIQDRVFEHGSYRDSAYQRRRDGTFIVAVNCTQAAATCFCTSMSSGPKADDGFDLALTELDPGGDHRFLVEIGSERGASLIDRVTHRKAEPDDVATAQALSSSTAASMARQMPADTVKDLLQRNFEHARWDEVAERCLTCGNCTMVCPTCFCTQIDEDTHLTNDTASRTKQWASCFGLDFSYIHGGSVRQSARSRYRQWITHKLASWHDQFGESGCVGCGRCITWCPVGIDITQEVKAIQDSEAA